MADRRQILFRVGLVAAAATAGAGLLAASPDPPPAQGKQQPVRVKAAAPVESVPLELPPRRSLKPDGGRDLFGTPAPPPPRPPVVFEPQPPPPPVAPPLPFTLVGIFESEGGGTVYYLAEAEKLHVVKTGEAVNGVYRLESAGPDQLEFLYLPLTIMQTLVPGSRK
jgi:hypothetical protein